MPRGIPTPSDLTPKVRELAAAGHSSKAIARFLGSDPGQIIWIASRDDIPLSGNVRWTERRIMEVRRLAAEGLTREQVADRMGETFLAIKNIARRKKIKFPFKPRRSRKQMASVEMKEAA